MVNEKILEFYEEFRDEVLGYVKENGPISTNTAFKALFLSYLTEAGETLVSDCTLVDFKKDGENMKLDGYAFSEYFHSLTLLVSKYQAKPQPEKVKKTEIDRLLKKALKFYKTCGTDSFEALEESSDGYQAYEFIKGHKEDIETVNIILLTNDETIRYIPEDTRHGKVTIRFDVWDIERLYQSVLGGAAVERQLVVKLKKKYGASLPLIKVRGDNEIYDCYIGVISGELLARIYEAEGQDLIQKNVRSFLQATGKVNKGIKASLASEPQMFMAYNNGISTVADGIDIDESHSSGDVVTITEITGWQIVNGGQTTASIYNAYKSKLPLDRSNTNPPHPRHTPLPARWLCRAARPARCRQGLCTTRPAAPSAGLHPPGRQNRPHSGKAGAHCQRAAGLPGRLRTGPPAEGAGARLRHSRPVQRGRGKPCDTPGQTAWSLRFRCTAQSAVQGRFCSADTPAAAQGQWENARAAWGPRWKAETQHGPRRLGRTVRQDARRGCAPRRGCARRLGNFAENGRLRHRRNIPRPQCGSQGTAQECHRHRGHPAAPARTAGCAEYPVFSRTDGGR